MTLVRFWGTRGSLPTAQSAQQVREKLTTVLEASVEAGLNSVDAIPSFLDGLPFHLQGCYGGESSCVQLETDSDAYFLFDMGSGLRRFAVDRMKAHGPQNPQTYNIFMSHVHHDHIMGFPFFVPAFIPGNKIRIIGCHDVLEHALRKQQEDPSFPVPFDFLNADIEFVKLTPGELFEIEDITVEPFLQLHHGDSYGYRVTHKDKVVVYSTDSEHKLDNAEETEHFTKAFRDADVVIFDAMYSLQDAISVKADWGHSSNIVGVDLCRFAGAKRYCMYHHEPVNSDEKLDEILAQTRKYEELSRQGGMPLEVFSAYDGLEIQL